MKTNLTTRYKLRGFGKNFKIEKPLSTKQKLKLKRLEFERILQVLAAEEQESETLASRLGGTQINDKIRYIVHASTRYMTHSIRTKTLM
jgi:hypothetical protein